MYRRRFLKGSVGGSSVILAGCVGENSEPTKTSERSTTSTSTDNPISSSTDRDTSVENTATEQPGEETTDEETTSEEPDEEYDVQISYSVHEQTQASGKYNIPDHIYEDWSWIVVDLEVESGTLDMSEIWFSGLFETAERYRTVDKATDEADNGLEPRGSIRSGGGALVLFSYPPSPHSGLEGLNLSMTDQSIGGKQVKTDGPKEPYPPVSLEYSVETSENPDVLDSSRAERKNGDERWAVVRTHVTKGVLNMEDVWFRSRLKTEGRIHEVDHSSSFAKRGVRSRGFVKQGNVVHVLYTIGKDESVETWGYEDPRQDVTVTRKDVIKRFTYHGNRHNPNR